MSSDSAHVPWDCALHWQKAGEPGRAIAAMRTCARQALALGQAAEACEVLTRLSTGQGDQEIRKAILEELVDIADGLASSFDGDLTFPADDPLGQVACGICCENRGGHAQADQRGKES